MSNRKANEDDARREQMQMLKERMQRSEKAVESYRQKEAHKNMLNKELAILKDRDMKIVHKRAKRLETRKKLEIMNKEKMNKESVRDTRYKEQRLVDFRFDNKVKHNFDRLHFSKTMDSWAMRGFSAKKFPKETISLLSRVEDRMKVRNTFEKNVQNMT
eukprot:CAMPEP_0170502754 /NCGR_PEP_ID=MMETSP0208-20121228/42494_1 /TAXON_ID=197538 /ORGANISM="Strombidium inclinatum, Strain S3" /LENGTH=158 /DNA_ID=CAMNT_0010782025 /DNA_START=1400 /DNA_END=1872 /DNA_ORIENTATION=+